MASRNINPLMLAGAKINCANSLTRGLVAAWNPNVFPAGNTLYDRGGAGHGTINGAAWAADAEMGHVLDFNGADHGVDLSPQSIWTMTAPFTIMFYVSGGAQTNRKIYSENSSVAGQTALIMAIGTDYASPYNKVLVQMRAGEEGATSFFHSVGIGFDGTWHHIVAVCDFTVNPWQVIFYLDGKHDRTQAGTVRAGTYAPNLAAIGTSLRASGKNFVGNIGTGMVYNRALSAAEIASLYANPYQIWDVGDDEMEWAKAAAAAAAGNPHYYYQMLSKRRAS